MRKLALAVLMVSAVAGGFMGCGGSSPARLTGTAGKGGNDGGSAGTGSAGSTAGAGGAAGAGDTGTAGGTAGAAGGAGGATAGAGGAAGDTGGAGGMAGAAGAAGTPPPVLSYCEMHPELVHALPYTIAQDFKVVHVLSNNDSAAYWKVVGTPDCSDNPTYPPFPSSSTDGGIDGSGDAAAEAGEAGEAGTEAGVDGGAADSGDETLTLQLDDPDAGDGGVADAAVDAPVDAPADVPASDGSSTTGGTDGGTDGTTDVAVNDGGADAGSPLPACYEFSYDPDGCVGNCWAGAVFEVTDVQGPSPDTKGVCIQTGAMNVEFWARASKNDARVKFGSIGEGVNTTEFYLNITTTWTRYTVAIPASLQSTYNTTAGDMQGVWNAFSLVVEQPDHAGGTYIEVKDIHWIATP